MNDGIFKENKGTTVVLKHEAYLMVRRNQIKNFNNFGKDVNIQDIVNEAVKVGIKIIEIDENTLNNLLYKDIIQVLEPLESKGKYKGNSHHLTQEIVEKLSPNIMMFIYPKNINDINNKKELKVDKNEIKLETTVF